jgi:hypothetical protein
LCCFNFTGACDSIDEQKLFLYGIELVEEVPIASFFNPSLTALNSGNALCRWEWKQGRYANNYNIIDFLCHAKGKDYPESMTWVSQP